MSGFPKLSKSQQNSVLLAAILASSMAFIDSTALNVALPALQRSLSLSATQLLWIVNGYTLFLAALTLLGGSLGDLYGKKKVFLMGISSFTLFSAACGFAPNGEVLIFFRALQGIGAALMVPGSLAIISATFPNESRGKAIGTWSMFSAFTTVLGPMLGGFLAESGWWRAIFWINIPFGIFSVLLLLRIAEPARLTGRKLDLWGALFATLACGGLTYGFIEAGERGFGQWWIWFTLGIGAFSLVAFILREARTKEPMMPLTLFRSSTFTGANAMTVFVYGALSGILFFVPLNLIQVQHYPESMAGLAILPFGGTIAILARVSGTWTDKVGARLPLIIGPVITGIAFFCFSLIGLTSGASAFWTTFFPVLLLAGIGMGITVVPLTTAVMNCVADKDTGIASGVNNALSRLAGVLAIAILGVIAIIQFESGLMERTAPMNFSEEKIEFLKGEAQNLADTEAPAGWGEAAVKHVDDAVAKSFVDVFNFTAIVASILCFIGALISWFFIKARPKQVVL